MSKGRLSRHSQTHQRNQNISGSSSSRSSSRGNGALAGTRARSRGPSSAPRVYCQIEKWSELSSEVQTSYVQTGHVVRMLLLWRGWQLAEMVL